MLRIATHNSGTGEKGTFWSWFVCLFSRTQDKTITEQHEAGCRYFDFRIKFTKDGSFKFGHGLWKSKKDIYEILSDLELSARKDDENKTYAYLTYEGKYSDEVAEVMTALAALIGEMYPHILITSVDAKYSGTKKNPFIVDYKHICTINRCPIGSNPQGVIALDGKHWQTFLPIPRLWNWIYTRHHTFDEQKFTFVDFL